MNLLPVSVSACLLLSCLFSCLLSYLLVYQLYSPINPETALSRYIPPLGIRNGQNYHSLVTL